MIDLSTAIAFTICSKNPLVIKVLGPTADYIGKGIKSFAEKQVKNVKRIFNRASEILDNHGTPTGAVPPRILKQILEEGSYIDNELTAEYYSGVLASSKSDQPRDDRALTILKLLSSMSNYEIRLHYILYSTFREAFSNSDKFNVTDINQSIKCRLFFPIDRFMDSFTIEQGEDINTIIEHAIPGLANRGLIGTNYIHGNKNYIKKQLASIDGNGIVASPSLFGTQLYLAAQGYLNISANKLCDLSLELELWNKVKPLKDVIIIE